MPSDDITGQVTERGSPFIEILQVFQGFMQQVLGHSASGLEADQGRVGGFVQGLIGSLRFSKGFGIALHIQNVVLNLKCQANALGVVIKFFQGCRLNIRLTQGTKLHAGADQGAGFMDMHTFQFGNIEGLSNRGQINGLPPGHAA